MMMIGMTALYLCSVAQEEEVRRLIREFSEMPSVPTPERDGLINQLLAGLMPLDPDEAFPVYYQILEEKFDDPNYVTQIMRIFLWADGRNIASYGQQEALDWARKLMRDKKPGQGFEKGAAVDYLLVKGDERDIDLMSNRMWRERLAMRVAGTNLINFWQKPWSTGVNWEGCLPSVTNTGPQGVYVQEILRKVWENLEIEIERGTEDWDPPARFRDSSKIPDELLTMVVWFDKDGNPVCNVDLAKYGLTMPVIEPKPTGSDSMYYWDKRTVTFPPPSEYPPPKVATTSLSSADDTQPVDTPPNRLYLYIALLVTLCATATLWLIRKKR